MMPAKIWSLANCGWDTGDSTRSSRGESPRDSSGSSIAVLLIFKTWFNQNTFLPQVSSRMLELHTVSNHIMFHRTGTQKLKHANNTLKTRLVHPFRQHYRVREGVGGRKLLAGRDESSLWKKSACMHMCHRFDRRERLRKTGL